MKKYLAIVFGFALIGLVVYMLQPSDVGDISVDSEPAEAGEVRAVEGPPETLDLDTAREDVTAEAVAETVEIVGPPDSYRKALGGMIGRIVEPEGDPVPDTKVELIAATLTDFMPDIQSLFSETPPNFNEVKAEAVTDEEGRFHFDELQIKGFYALGIDLGGARATFRFIDQSPRSGDVIDLGDIPLDPFVIFTGRVVDEKRQPVSGARIRATNLPSIIFNFGAQNIKPGFSVAYQEDISDGWRVAAIPRWLPRMIERFPIPETVSNEDGTFRLDGVPLGMITVLVDKEDLVSLTHGPVPSGNSGERDIGDLRLSFGEVLTGRVVTQDDEPIANAEVLAGPQLEMAPAAILAPIGVTDEDGYFSARGLSDLDHVVAARPQGAVDWTLAHDVVPGFDEAVIKIEASYQITVSVLTAAGEVIRHPSLVVRPNNRIPLHPLLVAPLPLANRTTYKEDGSVVVTDLDAGKYSVLARSDGYTIGKAQVDLTEGSESVEMVLMPEHVAEVSVVAAGAGEPVHYALVGVFDPTTERALRRVPLVSQRTDEDGITRLRGLEPGSYKVAAFHPAYSEAIVDLEVPGPPCLVELQKGGTIRGVVLEGGSVPQDSRFVATGKQERFPRFTITDEDGGFELTHLEPGDYTVTVMRRFANRSLGDQIGGGWNSFFPEKFVPVTVVEGEVTEVVIDILDNQGDGPTGNMRGRVSLNGLGGSGLTVYANSGQNWRSMKSAVTDATGMFDLGEVPAGSVTVTVRGSGRAGMFGGARLAQQKVELTANEYREVQFDIRTGRVSGRVLLDSDNSPVLAAEVRIRSSGASSDWNSGVRQQTISDRDGSFYFDQVPEGKYNIQVEKRGFANAAVSDVEVPYNGAPPPVMVRLITGVVVEGTLVLPPGEEEPRFIWLELRSTTDGGLRAGERVDLDTMKFKVKGVMPGPYEAIVYGAGKYAPVTVDVPSGGLSSLNLVLEPWTPSMEENWEFEEEIEEEEEEDG